MWPFNKHKKCEAKIAELKQALKDLDDHKVAQLKILETRHANVILDLTAQMAVIDGKAESYKKAYEAANTQMLAKHLENQILFDQIMNPNKKVKSGLELFLDDLLTKSNVA